MKDNLDKVLERDAKLSTLENRAGKHRREPHFPLLLATRVLLRALSL